MWLDKRDSHTGMPPNPTMMIRVTRMFDNCRVTIKLGMRIRETLVAGALYGTGRLDEIHVVSIDEKTPEVDLPLHSFMQGISEIDRFEPMYSPVFFKVTIDE